MLKIMTVVGARPQFIKASAISRAIRLKYADQLVELIVHTGQHYDASMSDVFFSELGLPAPHINLDMGHEPARLQLPKMILGIQEVIQAENPDFILVYGDTTSTLAGAIAAKNEGIPLVHVEAGLRSYQKAMPEEVNRILTDQLSTYLFVPTAQSVLNLQKEGIKHSFDQKSFSLTSPAVVLSGDVMLDNALYFTQTSREAKAFISELGLKKDGYLILTLHRDFNADNPLRLEKLLEEILKLVNELGVQLIFPIHPRTEKMVNSMQSKTWQKWLLHDQIRLISPVSYLEMLSLLGSSMGVLTDSGGLPKEAFFLGKPSLILREDTEWPELIEAGYGILIDFDVLDLSKSWRILQQSEKISEQYYGNGQAAERICELLISGQCD
jgi:UDP-GlcNAc3NAcA epimerase